MKSLALLAAFFTYAAASVAERAVDETIVDLNSCSGTPQLYGQGILYGFSKTSKTPPQSYIKELKLNYESAGGAQVDQQPAGYASSMASYQRRFDSVVDAWKRISKNNGVLIVKLADLYGIDFTQSSNFVFPGDNGDWTTWDNFLRQVIKDLKSSGMASQSWTTQLEIFNEPDLLFNGRPQSQYNEMYVRGTKALRAAFPYGSNNFLPIVGPSTSSRPYNGNGWWNTFAAYLRDNGGQSVQPDVWNWHLEENNNNDPIPPAQYLPGFLQSYGLSNGIGYQNNEFGIRSQQVPSYGVWFKARYERLKFNGLRGNWAMGSQLSDLLADLLIKNSDGSYSTTGEYMAYKSYAKMKNSPCQTTSGSSIDSYATAGHNNATALIGSQMFTGTATVTFKNVNAQFGAATALHYRVIHIPYKGGKKVTKWTTGDKHKVTVHNNAVSVSLYADDPNDAFAVRLFA